MSCDITSCRTRRGHNEMDNPSLTQPTMYNVIDKRPSVPDLYSMELEVRYGCSCTTEHSVFLERTLPTVYILY